MSCLGIRQLLTAPNLVAEPGLLRQCTIEGSKPWNTSQCGKAVTKKLLQLAQSTCEMKS